MHVILPANSALNVTTVHFNTELHRDELMVYNHSIPWLADPSHTLSDPPTRRFSGDVPLSTFTLQPSVGTEGQPGRFHLPCMAF
jgi:hypothetical protein